ncbi:G5 domain-containing protein, partial [Eubacteriales bacterium DFI.9.88]|nr:G5 domain-containing protein [Eubacteriales bacterium DFI.9.88]
EKEELTVKTTEVVTEEEPIAFKETHEKMDKLYVGQTKVKKEGRSGLKKVTKKITKENGEAVKTDVVEEEILQEAEPQVVLTGTKENEEALFTASRGT